MSAKSYDNAKEVYSDAMAMCMILSMMQKKIKNDQQELDNMMEKYKELNEQISNSGHSIDSIDNESLVKVINDVKAKIDILQDKIKIEQEQLANMHMQLLNLEDKLPSDL